MTIQTSFKDQATSALIKGSIIMGLQTPFVNPLNRISVVQSDKGFSSLQAIKAIISGVIDNENSPKKSLWNLQGGLSGHLIKETTRLSFKPFGAAILKPKIGKQLSTKVESFMVHR